MIGSSLLFVLVTLVTFTTPFLFNSEMNSNMDKYSEECAAELGLDAAEIKNIDKTNAEAWKNMYKHENFKCYFKCVAEKSGINGLDVKQMSETFKLSDDQIKIAETCVAKYTTQEDICTRVTMTLACIAKDAKL